jgi:hypothetical protein
MLDRKKKVFGGFTPLTYDSNDSFKVDDSLRRFLAVLKDLQFSLFKLSAPWPCEQDLFH